MDKEINRNPLDIEEHKNRIRTAFRIEICKHHLAKILSFYYKYCSWSMITSLESYNQNITCKVKPELLPTLTNFCLAMDTAHPLTPEELNSKLGGKKLTAFQFNTELRRLEEKKLAYIKEELQKLDSYLIFPQTKETPNEN